MEKWTNLGETTLAGNYTSGGSSISVISAAAFPTTGTFRVRLGNIAKTVFRVDSVSGTTFTGAAEFNDGNASGGQTVTLVVSRGALERLLQSPAAGEGLAPSGVSGVDEYGPSIFKVKRLDQSAWSWVNQNSFSVAQASGVVFLSGTDGGAGTNVSLRVTAAPGTPYTITLGIAPQLGLAGAVADLHVIAFAFRESGTGKLIILAISNFDFNTANAPATLAVAQYDSATVFNSLLAAIHPVNILSPIWLRAQDSGVNLVFSYSYDNVNFTQLFSVSRTAFMAGGPDQVGIAGVNQNGTMVAGGSILSWIQT